MTETMNMEEMKAATEATQPEAGESVETVAEPEPTSVDDTSATVAKAAEEPVEAEEKPVTAGEAQADSPDAMLAASDKADALSETEE